MHRFSQCLFIIVLTSIILCSGLVIAQSDRGQGQYAVLVPDIGQYSYLVKTDSPQAQRFFDQGLRLFYGYYFPESLASFQEAARLDPDCPMMYWGMALAIAPNPNSRYLGGHDDPQGKGARAIEQAMGLIDRAAEKEKGLIRALMTLYDRTTQPDRTLRDLAYAQALKKLLEQYPDDPEVGTLYASSLMTPSAWDYWTPDGQPRPDTKATDNALQHVLDRYPDHPGANHLYIHLLENSHTPGRALPHAERLAKTMPNSGHIQHMPTHIYIRTGRYGQTIKGNQRSLEVDKIFLNAWGDRDIPIGVASNSLSASNHGMHAQDFLHMAAVLQGNYSTSIQSAQMVAKMIPVEQLGSSGALQRRYIRPWLTDKRFGKWDRILNQPQPSQDLPFLRGIWHYVRGSALAAKGRLTEAEQELVVVRKAADSEGMDTLMVPVGSARMLLTLAGHVLEGEIASRQGEVDRAMLHLDTAVRMEDGLPYMEPPVWGHPVRHSLGAVLMDAGRFAEAEVVYWEDLRRYPENGWSLYGVWQSLLKQGKTKRAKEAEKRFRAAWQGADVTLKASRF